MEVEKINWPFGKADKQTLAFAAVQAITIKNMLTILDFATLTAACTLNLTLDSQVAEGAIVLLKVPASGLFDLTLGTAIDGPNIVGVAGKTKTQGFQLIGGSFVPMGAVVQID